MSDRTDKILDSLDREVCELKNLLKENLDASNEIVDAKLEGVVRAVNAPNFSDVYSSTTNKYIDIVMAVEEGRISKAVGAKLLVTLTAPLSYASQFAVANSTIQLSAIKTQSYNLISEMANQSKAWQGTSKKDDGRDAK